MACHGRPWAGHGMEVTGGKSLLPFCSGFMNSATPTILDFIHKRDAGSAIVNTVYFSYIIIMQCINGGHLAVLCWNDCQEVIAAR